MLDVALIGGGLCGLALAHSLHARRIDFQLFEARDRFGGRVLGAPGPQGTRVDLGATWFWPETQPAMARLVADLGLPDLAQPDDGRVLVLHDPNRTPERQTVMNDFVPRAEGEGSDASAPAAGRLHGGARRLAGGMTALIDAFVERLPADRMHLQMVLTQVQDLGDHVRLTLAPAGAPTDASLPTYTVLARRVVLALPPRLVAEHVAFDPPLSPDLHEALLDVPTWMASAAKAAVFTARPDWRDAGHTGNAWSTHTQSVLAEVFDASASVPDGSGGLDGLPQVRSGALAGFFALDHAQRQSFERAMPLLLESQITALFGPCPELSPWVWQDWAGEVRTCSALDLAEEKSTPRHPEPTVPLVEAHWGGKLHFGGSETGHRAPGYLEGALSAAARLRSALAAVPGSVGTAAHSPESGGAGARVPTSSVEGHTA